VIGRLRRLATLQEATETETAFGGRSKTWEEVASVWIQLTITGGSEGSQAGQRPVLATSAEAVARDHPLAAAGQRLVVGGDNWRLVRVERGAPKLGLMTLILQKDET
jgi:head-tail adaptor